MHYQTHMGLGLLNMSAHHFRDAKTNFEHAAATSEVIAATNPGLEAGRRGLIQAYLQIGRADSFSLEFAAAEIWFRKMHDLAQHWTSEEPGSHLAYDLLASSYRKLGDVRKFARNFAAAQQDYLSAIAIGRDLQASEPDNLEFKSHLALALDDLAGVIQEQGQLPSARQLFQEAAGLFQELVASDSERLEYRLNLLQTPFKLASLERDDGQFETAAGLFRGILDRLLQLEREGRLERGRILFTTSKALRDEVAFCETAPRALTDFEFARRSPRFWPPGYSSSAPVRLPETTTRRWPPRRLSRLLSSTPPIQTICTTWPAISVVSPRTSPRAAGPACQGSRSGGCRNGAPTERRAFWSGPPTAVSTTSIA